MLPCFFLILSSATASLGIVDRLAVVPRRELGREHSTGNTSAVPVRTATNRPRRTGTKTDAKQQKEMGPDRGLNPGPRPNRSKFSCENSETLRANHTTRPSGHDEGTDQSMRSNSLCQPC
jgi:hypothetical protein